ncbi:TaqI-like C-terminal specificity domain-containing protein [Streptococcus mutans]|uniref:TaqI-like C-terminal specificity domain-containing protein n=1 Tax=Streptococcus mutans TaxID=1309 RepID=UPI002256C232|nr:TaqI-like C-terminal specificity domain-containing protein [Streptococcus mutans]MDB8629575.1 TaqI-like C-terminal specificity domain-containing protein [Streptococcus mutans]
MTTYNEYTDSNDIKHLSININDYPAVKKHLDCYWNEINKRQDKGDTPYNLRRCTYMDDFNKQKILFSEIVNSPKFYLDKTKKFVPEATAFLISGENKTLEYLLDWLNSYTISYIFKKFYAGGSLGDKGYRYKKEFLLKLPIPLKISDDNYNNNEKLIQERLQFSEEEINFISSSVKL